MPVHTAVRWNRQLGALVVVLVAIQLSVPGLYLPPVFKKSLSFHPPQTIISLLVQTDVGMPRGDGAPVVLVAVQLSVPGVELPPSFKAMGPINPPQTIVPVVIAHAPAQRKSPRARHAN